MGDLSSISGTDSSNESDIEEEEEVFVEKLEERHVHHQRGSPLVVFKTSEGSYHAIYKTLFTRVSTPCAAFNISGPCCS